MFPICGVFGRCGVVLSDDVTERKDAERAVVPGELGRIRPLPRGGTRVLIQMDVVAAPTQAIRKHARDR